MPKYELMYIIGPEVSENDIPKTVEEVKTYISEFEGNITKHEELGKRKLAYDIKEAKNGYYVLVQFEADPSKLSDIEKKIIANQEIIRHLVLNIDEALVRMEKDRAVQAKLQPRRREEVETAKTAPAAAKPQKKIEIDLDAEIEKALKSEDLK